MVTVSNIRIGVGVIADVKVTIEVCIIIGVGIIVEVVLNI